jgi:hypothetical protein
VRVVEQLLVVVVVVVGVLLCVLRVLLLQRLLRWQLKQRPLVPPAV